MGMKNILSIDVESWLHLYGDLFAGYREQSSAAKKRQDDGYIPRAVTHLLRELEAHGATATFFVLGEVYEWYPEAIHAIAQAGHEIGYHGHDHSPLIRREALADQARSSRAFLEAFRPKGFRAPRIHVGRECLPLLRDLGFEYSSSTYGVYRKRQMIDGIEEIPLSAVEIFHEGSGPLAYPSHLTFKLLMRQLPFGSGLFLSALRPFIGRLISHVNGKGEPAIIFLHTWQSCRARQVGNPLFKLRLGLRDPRALPYAFSIDGLFRRMLDRFEFVSFKEYRNAHPGVLEQKDNHLGRLDGQRWPQKGPRAG